jgi:hypothetical protein
MSREEIEIARLLSTRERARKAVRAFLYEGNA